MGKRVLAQFFACRSTLKLEAVILHDQERSYSDFLAIIRRSTDSLIENSQREEIFSVERLEQYAGYLATALKIQAKPGRGRSLLPELKKNGKDLLSAYLSLVEVVREKQAVSPAAEWFIDNFHIVKEQLNGIKRDLPPNYYKELPKLAVGELAGYPRVYAMSLAIIAHTDSRLDPEALRRFLWAFQRVSPLMIGELWAVSITLRIALVQYLKPLAMMIVSARKSRASADLLADELLELASQGRPEKMMEKLVSQLGAPEKFDRAFIVQLVQRLRDQDPDVWPAFDWLEKQLQVLGTNTIQVIQFEHHRQAAAQTTVGNIITSMRLLSALDWRDFFESVSVVDPLLAKDPGGAYRKMDFSTRDQYRHAIERIAKKTKCSETAVAEKVVEVARLGQLKDPQNERQSHIGYYLIGSGHLGFEKLFNYTPPLRTLALRTILRFPNFVYFFSVFGLTALILSPVIIYSRWWIALIALIPASELALNLFNNYITFFIRPKPLARMETEQGIPDDAKTMVVIPTLFSRESVVADLLENLEVQYLANQDSNIYFALLGDYTDSTAEHTALDERILACAQDGIRDLNARYHSPRNPRFYLFHRRRVWNGSESKWMGWERKRGKILEFNHLLRGRTNTTYLPILADVSFLKQIKYVITLDSDTQLSRDSAHRLIGTITHPLNDPYFCVEKGRVTEGYGILQPRVSVAITSTACSRFTHIFSGNIGLDPYTTAVSDVYQDLFAEGSFTGKGLYVVDAFESALENRVPENTVLSHDLFEGSYARSALVTDVELFDDYPSDYDSFSKRAHRWARGDWQLFRWLLPWVKDSNGSWVKNNLSLISVWKIFDNLRRSLVAPLTFVSFAIAWTVLPAGPLVGTLALLALICFPIYVPLLTLNIRNFFSEFVLNCQQIIFSLAFLPVQSVTQVDAIIRSLYRQIVSKKNLLEWVSSAQVEKEKKSQRGFFKKYQGSFLPILSVLALTVFFQPKALGFALPFVLLWLSTPFLKDWLQEVPPVRQKPLDADEISSYRRYARLTWQFFEKFVVAEDNDLAPDNFQMDPTSVVAHRTSPTNVGLQLLANAAAFDFGYIGMSEFVERTESTLKTLKRLQTFNGHFFNWYDTRTLVPLHPQYISTVDSGNLAGHMLTLKQVCFEISRGSLRNENAHAGLADTIKILLEEIKKLDALSLHGAVVTISQLQKSIEGVSELSPTGSWKDILQMLVLSEDILTTLETENGTEILASLRTWLNAILHQAQEHLHDEQMTNLDALIARIADIATYCEEIVLGMNFRFLFNESRKLFVIGYNVTEGRSDNSFYDLLASESRLASFVAIAKGEVPQEHWFRLGRSLTAVNGGRALIAWTATMFEYLMPLLVMRRYPKTLIDETYISVVRRQISYGKHHGIPWGMSEAGFNARDINQNYQYSAFGIPGLGLKRGLSDDLVISPYSTMLAAMINPRAALENLRRLEQEGTLSEYGFFESVDYTPSRLPSKKKSVVIKSFMAHHQGMSLLSMDNLLNKQIMQQRFHAEPIVKATELLLQERIPSHSEVIKPRAEEVPSEGGLGFVLNRKPRIYNDVNFSTPRTQLLSNGEYSVMVTAAGGGYSRCGPLSVNRWREDATQDNWGHFFYIRNRSTNKYWSASYQPVLTVPDTYEVTFTAEKAEFSRTDHKIHTHTEIIVSPEDNVELRRISLTNDSGSDAEFDVTSYLETTLSKPQDDAAHPAFSNLFVQTEFVAEENALLATRRRRSASEKQVWAFHVSVTLGECICPVQYETDRARFIGRGRSAANPVAISEGAILSNTVGSVLDPIFSLKSSVRVPAGSSVQIGFATGVTSSREKALELADKYHDVHIFSREADIAWTQAQVQLRHLNLLPEKADIYQRLAGRIIFSDASLRPRSHVLSLNTKTQSSLWAYGISGDLPIILMRISQEKDMAMIREVLHAHEYLRLKGLIIDLVILNERPPSYMQSLQDELQRQIRMSGSQALLDKPGGVFIRRTDIISESDILLFKSVARVVLSAAKGSLDEQLKRREIYAELPETFQAITPPHKYPAKSILDSTLKFFNGLGGFTQDGREYVIILREGQQTPAPWINVIANSHDFGFQVSESGAGYTWSANSRENRLTTWSNDPVTDPASEAIYIRDEDSGEFWSPTPLPIRGSEAYVITHGQGYTKFEHTSHGLTQELQLFVALDAGVKISRLLLKNMTTDTRNISVTSYAEWVLGFQRGTSAPSVITEGDLLSGIVLARNPYNNEFADRVAFAAMSGATSSFTCDRKEFLGRNGNATNPAAMQRVGLSGRHGAGFDPCVAQQRKLTLAPGEEVEVIVLLGQAGDEQAARRSAEVYKSSEKVNQVFEAVQKYWDKALGAIEIKTPDASMNVLVNRWLVYQTQACRLWARSAFYQSGGAFGFRDQLQDVMALVYSNPQLAKQQILRASQRQFLEGDVQHWWHPPTGRGVRTRFSDDLVWLPFVVSFYIKTTGDRAILKEKLPFIDGPVLEEGVDDSYTQPAVTQLTATLFEHCARTLDRSLKVGVHGLPLMGSGDWNDGMSRVGNEGKGESVWMAWFLYSALERFIPFCDDSASAERREKYSEHLVALKTAVEKNAWDGDWYLRAYFDNGQMLGSASNEECRIDSIAQSWAILSGAGDPQRAQRAMQAVDNYLIKTEEGLIRLFDPPFDKSAMDPGYIKGYVPGVRENGGQYTHAAIWTMMAYAEMGDGDRACELYSMLNPINHATTRAGLSKYKVEPYVMAADIYGRYPHVGRGGWTWYTGSSSWMYRAAIESILGFDLRGNILRMKPCIPKHWQDFEMTYRSATTEYKIYVRNMADEVTKLQQIHLDGVLLDSGDIPLAEDGLTHEIRIQM